MKLFLASLCLLISLSAHAANFPFIRLNGKTNQVSDNGTALTRDGVPLGGSSLWTDFTDHISPTAFSNLFQISYNGTLNQGAGVSDPGDGYILNSLHYTDSGYTTGLNQIEVAGGTNDSYKGRWNIFLDHASSEMTQQVVTNGMTAASRYFYADLSGVRDQAYMGSTVQWDLRPNVADGPSAIAYTLNAPNLADSGAKLLSIGTTSEKAYVDVAGNYVVGGAMVLTNAQPASATLTNLSTNTISGTGVIPLQSVVDGKQPLAATLTSLSTNSITGTGTIPLSSAIPAFQTNVVTTNFVAKTGDTMTGNLTVPGLTNTARTASTFVVADANKADSSTATSAVLAATLSDETGTGVAVFGTSPTLTTSVTVTNAVIGTVPITINHASGATTNALEIYTGGTSRFIVKANGVLGFSSNTGNGALRANGANLEAVLLSEAAYTRINTSVVGVIGSAGSTGTTIEADAAAVLQLGTDAATATAQTLKAHDGSGTDKAGADLTLEGGQSTGTGTSGAFNIATGLTGEASGSTANAYSIRYHAKAKFVALTHATATEIIKFSLPANKLRGGTITALAYATNSTPHLQALTSEVSFQAVAVGTNITATISQVDSTTAASSGTLTCTYTIVDNTDNTFSIKANAASSLSSPVERCKLIVTGMSGTAATTITDP